MTTSDDGVVTSNPLSREPRSGPGRRWLGRLVSLVLSLAILGWATRWVDLPWWPVAVVQSVVPAAGIAVLAATVTTVLLRRRRMRWVGAVASALVLLVAVPGSWPWRAVTPGGGRLVVLSSNLEFGQGDPGQLLALVRAQQVDVLVLLELTPSAREALLAAGLDALLPHEVGQTRPGADGTVIRSRYPLTALDGVVLPKGRRDLNQPAARVAAPSGPITVLAVHPYPPSNPGSMPHWQAGLEAIGVWAQGQSRGIPVVLAGDFNASSDHPAFRSATTGFVDAHAASGAGWVRTWPQESRVPPFVQLDHVLARDLGGVLSVGAAVVPGSDHAAVWAAWAVPAR